MPKGFSKHEKTIKRKICYFRDCYLTCINCFVLAYPVVNFDGVLFDDLVFVYSASTH